MKSKIERILESDDNELFEEIAGAFMSEALSDDEPYNKKGRAFLKAAMSGSADDMCVAFTGWSIDSILKKCGAVEDDDGVSCAEYTLPWVEWKEGWG